MAKKSGRPGRKTRYRYRKELGDKGKLSITRFLQQLNAGDKVALTVESSIQKGMYHPRYMGKTAVIKGKKGRCYEVVLNDQGKEKLLIVHPVHLKRL